MRVAAWRSSSGTGRVSLPSELVELDDLYIERGGPAYRLMQRVGLIQGDGPSLRRRIVAFWCLTWVPLLGLAFWEGVALHQQPQLSLLCDFAAYARFLIGIPLLFVAEMVIGERVTRGGRTFIDAGLVGSAEYPAFQQAVRRLARWRDSLLAEVVLVGIAFVGAWLFTIESLYGEKVTLWHSALVQTPEGPRYSAVGLYYSLVAVPIVQFFLYRWMWRYLIWVRFLYDMSRLPLRLVPTHADGAAGLAFLGSVQMSFGILASSVCIVLSAAAGSLIVFHDVGIETFRVHFITVIAISELLFLGPLTLFTPALVRTRLAWLRHYGQLVLRYNRAFHQKWVDSSTPADEALLGSGDIQSLADLGNAYGFIREMRTVPFSFRIMLQLAVVTVLPTLPLLLLVMPVDEVVNLLSRALL